MLLHGSLMYPTYLFTFPFYLTFPQFQCLFFFSLSLSHHIHLVLLNTPSLPSHLRLFSYLMARLMNWFCICFDVWMDYNWTVSSEHANLDTVTEIIKCVVSLFILTLERYLRPTGLLTKYESVPGWGDFSSKTLHLSPPFKCFYHKNHGICIRFGLFRDESE